MTDSKTPDDRPSLSCVVSRPMGGRILFAKGADGKVHAFPLVHRTFIHSTPACGADVGTRTPSTGSDELCERCMAGAEAWSQGGDLRPHRD